MTVPHPLVAALLLTCGTAGLLIAASVPAPASQAEKKTVVIAELFTSEGCSSCPPADDLLRRLVATQPVEGVEIVGLGSHVDYWDRLGWRDPFSSALFSTRQSSYDTAVFRSDRIYTPQLVVDGTYEAVGSDAAAVRRIVLEAARAPKATVSVTAVSTGARELRVAVAVDVPATVQSRGEADVLVAVTEDELVTRVPRGENGGRTLSHSAVVRSLTTAGRLGVGERTTSATLTVPIDDGWRSEHLRIVAFVQEEKSRRILGSGTARLARSRESQ